MPSCGRLTQHGRRAGNLLRPEDQFKKAGLHRPRNLRSDRIKLLDENRCEVPEGEVGELFYRTPMLFKEYLKEPEKTKAAFAGDGLRPGIWPAGMRTAITSWWIERPI